MPDDNGGGLLRPSSAHALSKSSSDIPSQLEVKPRSESYPNGDIAPPNTARAKRDSNGTIGSTTTSLSYVEFRVTPPGEPLDRRKLFQQRDGSGKSFGGFTNGGARGELARAKSLRTE